MKILIAIKTCHRYRERAQAQRETWIPRLMSSILLQPTISLFGFFPNTDRVHRPRWECFKIDFVAWLNRLLAKPAIRRAKVLSVNVPSHIYILLNIIISYMSSALASNRPISADNSFACNAK
jgi:hypothetical protein